MKRAFADIVATVAVSVLGLLAVAGLVETLGDILR